MENINLKSDGSIEGAKTNFFNHFTGHSSEDKVFMRLVGKSYLSFCFDIDGHFCQFCEKKKNIFFEFFSGKTIRICEDCSNHISTLFKTMLIND